MYRIGGKQRRMTWGEYPVLKLSDAHDRAREALELVRRGIDPAEEQRRREEAEVARRLEGFTFEMLAKRFRRHFMKRRDARLDCL